MYDPEIGPDPSVFRGLLAPEAVLLERLDDTLCKVAHLVEHFNDWCVSEREAGCDDALDLTSNHFPNYSVIGIVGKTCHVDLDSFDGIMIEFKCQPTAT